MIRLPLEVLTRIMGLVAPLDIISLRMSCKFLYKASLERCVWLNAYKAVLGQADIPAPPYIETSFSSKNLEYAAISPVLFFRQIQKQPVGQFPRPSRVSIAIPRGNLQDSVRGDSVQNISLVDGGRYALVAFDNALELWDFGPAYAPYNSYQTLDRYILPERLDRGFTSLINRFDDGYHFFIMTVQEGGNLTNLRRYTIDFNKKSPKMEEQACLGISGGTFWDRDAAMHTDQTLFVLSRDEQTIVWNFLEDTVGEFLPYSEVLNVYIVNERKHLVMVHPSQLSVYEMPELKPKTFTWQHSPVIPLTSVPYPEPVDGEVSVHSTAYDYHDVPDGGGPTHIKLICSSNGSTTARIYEVIKMTGASYYNSQTQPVTILLPRLVEVYRMDLTTEDFTMYCHEVDSNNHLLFYVSTRDFKSVLSCSLIHIDASGTKKSLPSKQIYSWRNDPDYTCWSLCPVSGRLCVLTEDREVRIIDFVHLPN